MNKRVVLRGTALTLLLIFVYVFAIFPVGGMFDSANFSFQDAAHQASADACGERVRQLNIGMPRLGRFFSLPDSKKQAEKNAYIGGFPIAMALYTDGVIVEEISAVDTELGKATPSAQLLRGDFLIEVAGEKITKSGDIEAKLNALSNDKTDDQDQSAEDNDGKVTVMVLRGGEKKSMEITPAIEVFSNKRRLGLVVRDYILGIGTVSFVKEDGSFGALGHPVADAVAGRVPIRGGHIFNCEEISIVKGEKGTPGEFRVRISSVNNPIGEVYRNSDNGVYGKFNSLEFAQKAHSPENRKLFPVARHKKVNVGKAMLCTTVDGKTEFYKMEIIKAINQSSVADKGLIVRVTDKRLIDKTGGIIQGMSGSPIIQNGALVGTVTHVFINDPTKGYGIYMDWMYQQ